MSENRRRRAHRETVQALVGVTVIAIGLLATLILHLTHDNNRHGPPPRPSPPTTSAQPPSRQPPIAAAATPAAKVRPSVFEGGPRDFR